MSYESELKAYIERISRLSEAAEIAAGAPPTKRLTADDVSTLKSIHEQTSSAKESLTKHKPKLLLAFDSANPDGKAKIFADLRELASGLTIVENEFKRLTGQPD